MQNNNIQKHYTKEQIAWMKTKERQAFKAICKKHKLDKLIKESNAKN